MVTMLKPRLATLSHQRVKAMTVSETKRTRGSAWQVIRRRILKRDCGLCVVCRSSGRLTPASEVDHIRPLWSGGTDADHNLQSICGDCHKSKTDAEASKRAAGECIA